MIRDFLKGVAVTLAAGAVAAGVCVLGYVSRDKETGKWFRESDTANWSFKKTTSEMHEHTYNLDVWVKGADSHWHAANCGHDLVIDVAPHNYNSGGTCTVCGYKRGSIIPYLSMTTEQENRVALASNLIALSDYEAYGISPQAETAYTFTTTVVDENGTTNGVNQNVEVNAEWENALSDWARGKNVSDYMQVNQTAENTFTVTCLQGFCEPILININSVIADVFAVKRCDYVKRVTDINFNFDNGGMKFDFCGMPNSYTATASCGVGTVQGEVNYSYVNVHFLDEFITPILNSTYYKYFIQQCERADIAVDFTQEFSVDFAKATMSSKDCIQFSWEEMFLANMSAEEFNKVKTATNNCEYFKYALIDATKNRVAPYDFTCTLSYVYSYNGVVYSSGFSSWASGSISDGGLGTPPQISDILTDPDGNFIF